MEQRRITLDAHTLIWFFHKESNSKLALTALTVIKEAEAIGTIYVSTIALMEVMRVLEKGLYSISFDVILQYIEENEAYRIVSLTTHIIKIIRNLQGNDLHDRVIIATALLTNSALVSKDREFKAPGLNVIWSKSE